MEAAKVSEAGLIEALRLRFEETARDVARAVNAAPDGAWINGSEEKVRDILAEFRRVAFQTAVQMRTDAAAAAFPPSARPEDRRTAPQQGVAGPQLADGQRPGGAAAQPLPRLRGKRRPVGRPD